MAKNPHVVMVPYPAQGHVIPMLELARSLAKHGVRRITYVNTEVIHQQFVDTLFNRDSLGPEIHLVSIPDGVTAEERHIPGKSMKIIYEEIPRKIKELVRGIINLKEENDVSCIVYDQFLCGIFEVAKKLGIGSVAFLPSAAAVALLGFNIPKLIDDGIIDNEGNPLKNDPVKFGPSMPIITPEEFIWSTFKIPYVRKLMLNIFVKNIEPTKSSDWLLCNSVYGLEPEAFELNPHIVPIGPLLSDNNAMNSKNHSNDRKNAIIEWLDQKPLGSIVYVAFGSTGMLDEDQFRELALGLEKTQRPFLWVVRRDNTPSEFLDGFEKRVSKRGKIVDWAPQQSVLHHHSIACFVSHCGWNSTIESVSCGVPMLCWPYFADQFINRAYACDVWKVGLDLEHDKSSGVVTSEEIRTKIDRLLSESVYKEIAMSIKDMVQMSSSGNSRKHLSDFVTWLKG